MTRYGEPHRKYHDTRHLREMFTALDTLGGPADRTVRLRARLAIWFHDAVYDPRATANELRSSDLAREYLSRLGCPTDVVEDVCAVVLATSDHLLGPAVPRAVAVRVLDADLWILGSPVERFDEYCNQVREEYSFVDGPTYGAARSAILSRLLQRPRLYNTDHAHRAWTEPARANLRRELQRLR